VKFKFSLLILSLFLVVLIPLTLARPVKAQIPISSAANNIDGKDVLNPAGSSAQSKTQICNSLFAGDEYNIFREITCDLIAMVSNSVANFATNITCSIQSVGVNGNFLGTRIKGGQPATFSYSGSACEATGGLGNTVDQIYGNKSSSNPPDPAQNTGFNAPLSQGAGPPASELTNTLLGGGALQTAFNGVRSFSVIIALATIFLLAFAQILHINVNTYAIKKALPQIAIAVVGGFFGLTIVGFISRLIDFLYRFNFFTPYQALHPYMNIFGGGFNLAAVASSANYTVDASMNLLFSAGSQLMGSATSFNILSGILGFIILTVPAIAVFAFEYVMALRPVIVETLAIASPFAFAALILPQTQWLFRKWWTYLTIALVYPLLINFSFYIFNLFTLDASGGTITFILRWMIKTGLLVILIRAPFTIEKDLSAIASLVGRTNFGASLGLSKYTLKREMAKASAEAKGKVPLSADRSLSSRLAQTIVAPTNRNLRVAVGQAGVTSGTLETRARISPIATTAAVKIAPIQIDNLAEQANRANLSRSPRTLVQSITDIKPETFKNVISRSDRQIWRDTRLIEQLKDRNGQKLDDGGAAVRADAIRKTVRLAEHTEGGKIQHPETIKLLAQKGTLTMLPVGILKQAKDEGVIKDADLSPSFGQNAGQAIQTINNYQGGKTGYDAKNIAILMQEDQKDFQSGYSDLTRVIQQAVKSNQPANMQTAQSVVNNFRSSDPSGFERTLDKFGDHFLNRLGQDLRSSQGKLSQNLMKTGLDKEKAVAFSINPSSTIEQAISQIPQEKKTPESILALKESFAERNMHQNVTGQVAKDVMEDKKAVTGGIAEKLLGSSINGKNIDNIASEVKTSTKKLDTAKSPEEIKEVSKTLDQYYPGVPLESEQLGLDPESIEKLKKKSSDITDTIGIIKKTDTKKEDLANKPVLEQKITQGLSEQITDMVNGKDQSWQTQS